MNNPNYTSHIGQDMWVCEVLRFKRHGYFLDFGALDGLLTSNTYCLEKELGWDGIVVEANPTSYPAVCRNRSTITINAALWRDSRVAIQMVDAHGLSSAIEFKDSDLVSSTRAEITTRTFSIDTINPTELLERFSAPQLIDYLSLDVEGAELQILEAFDFTRYQPALMTIEHGELPERQEAIRQIVQPHGYEVVKCRYDDLFWRTDLLVKLCGENGFEDPRQVHERVASNFVVK